MTPSQTRQAHLMRDMRTAVRQYTAEYDHEHARTALADAMASAIVRVHGTLSDGRPTDSMDCPVCGHSTHIIGWTHVPRTIECGWCGSMYATGVERAA